MNPFLQIDNESLVQECVKGNSDALNLFYTRFAPKMFGVVMRYVSNPKDAEDILHDGFIIAFTRLSTLRTPERLEYWLATIMKNLSLRFLQSQDVVSILSNLPEVEDSPEFDDIIDLPTLEALIRKLPKGYQTVFRLSVLENKTHKEIAEILGIAPNSSSSQLFHAKLMMRRLINEHRGKIGLLSLILILLTIGMFWRHTPAPSSPATIIEHKLLASESAIPSSAAGSHTKPTQPPVTSSQQQLSSTVHRPDSAIIATALPFSRPDISSDSITQAVAEDYTAEAQHSINDSIHSIHSETSSHNPLLATDLYAHDNTHVPITVRRGNGMTFKVGGSTMVALQSFANQDLLSANSPTDSNQPGLDIDNNNKQRNISTDFKNLPHTNSMPVTVGVSINKSFSRFIGMETGLTYTYLHSTLKHGEYFSDCRWHYLGIPLKVTVNNYTDNRFRLYAAAGLQFDFPLNSSASTRAPESVTALPRGRFHSSPVWSVSASYGAAINLTSRTGLFIEPTVTHHFNHSFDVPNSWTDNHLGLSLLIGVQFKF